MSDKHFGSHEFAEGSIVGHRAWTVTRDGELAGVSHATVWTPGEALAKCVGAMPPAHDKGETWEERYKRAPEWRKTHAMAECGHGFYAYYQGEPQRYLHGPGVHGVIEGYGEVLIGTKGFRAMKARILAVAVEPFEGTWHMDPSILARIRANYPAVAVFESTLAMGVEFPADDADKYAAMLGDAEVVA